MGYGCLEEGPGGNTGVIEDFKVNLEPLNILISWMGEPHPKSDNGEFTPPSMGLFFLF